MIKLLSGCIASTDNVLTINIDKQENSSIFGIVTLLPSKVEIITQFNQRSSTLYVTRLRIDADLLQAVEAATLTIEIVSGTFSTKYPNQNLPVDREKIKQNSLKTEYKEIYELKLQIRALEETLKSLTEGRALTQIALKNTDIISPGMVPVAIDNKGTFVAMFPFNDMVKDINGITPVGSSIKLTAEDIPLISGISLQEAWSMYIQTTTKILEYISTIETQLSEISAKLKNLETNFATHINTGII